MNNKPSIFSEELTGLEVTKPASYAAGPLAIQKTLEHLMNEMGPLRAFQAINKMNKVSGFDCPGCAWPDPDDKRSVLGEYCENGAKALAEEATLKRVDIDFFGNHSLPEMRSWSDYKIGKAGRLTHPMIIRPGQSYYHPIQWNEAFDMIADQLKSLSDPNQAVFYTSGRSSNEAAFIYSLLARRLGTNNLPDCSNMCHESSGVALSQTLGIGKGSTTLDDLHNAEVIMIIGQNPGTNHPRMLTALQKAKKNGAKVITINPLEEAGLKRFRNPQKPLDLISSGTAITDCYMPVKINQDIPLLKALMKGLITADNEDHTVLDHDFVQSKTSGYEQLLADLDRYDLTALLKSTGIKEENYQQALDILIPAKKIIICWAMGLTQHKNGVDNIKECVNLLLMKGAIGKSGAGTCPVRGHSNVQGDRTVGINHKLPTQMAERIREVFKFEPPIAHGYDVVEAIMAMHSGKAKFFMGLGGNFATAASDTHYTIEAMESCVMTVHISTKLNRTHLHPGKIGLILPTLGRSEEDLTGNKTQKITVENSMGKVQPSMGSLEPASAHLMSEPAIIASLGVALFGDQDLINWKGYQGDYNLIRDDIEQIVSGFNQYNERVKNGNEFYLPNNAREAKFEKLPNGKAQFSICTLPDHDLASDEYLLTTIRSHDQFNTTIYGLDDRYRGIYNERRVIFINPNDMKLLGLSQKELIDVSSTYDHQIRWIRKFHVVAYDIPQGNLAAYFPETNPLIPIDQFAIESQTPISKSVKVRLHKRLSS